MRQMPSLAVLALTVALLAACGRQDDAPAASGAGPAAAPAATPAKDDGGLFGFIDKDDAPAESAAPDLGQFQIVSLTLGNALDADRNVREARTVFSPNDPIHAAVLSSGPHAGLTLAAHWTAADGTVVAHTEQALVPTGPTVTTFSLDNPQPWPPGLYQVAVQVDGKTLQSRAFEIVEPQVVH
jgi:hypothetical protein